MGFKPKGIIAALITPTDSRGNLKEEAAKRLVKHVIDGGIHGLFSVGTAGEFYALEKETKIRMTEITLEEADGRLPVYMGAAGSTTRESLELARAAERIGVNAITVLTPSFIKYSDDELYDHYKAIADSTSLPIVLYSLPGLTGVGLSANLIVRLCAIDSIIGIKDSSGDLSLTERYIRMTPHDFSVLAGRDTLILPTLLYGGKGGVAATANIVPRLVVSIYEYYNSGELDKAKEAQLQLAPLRNAFTLGSSSAAMLKEAANLLGLDVGRPVAPARSLTEADKRKLREILKALGEL